MRRPSLALAASLLSVLPSLAFPQEPAGKAPATAAPAPTPAPAPAAAPVSPQAARAARAARLVDLHDLSCDQYMSLDDGLRPAVVWYIAGDYKAAGRLARAFDPDLVSGAGAHVWVECRKHPQANLRYVVVGYFKAMKDRAAELESQAKGKKRSPGHLQ